ncbi:MAG: Mur ligase family protein [Pseudomonadota bacterium]
MSTILLHGAGKEAAAAASHFVGQGLTPLLYVDGDGSIAGTKSVAYDEARRALPGAIYLRSPGVQPNNPLAAEAARTAKLATTPTGYWLVNHAPEGAITVTGTKGKSTTTALLSSVLQAAGLKSAVYGNIGSPPLTASPVTETHPMIEVSSYMMHDLPKTDHLHLVTSLFKEHTDWHGSEASYRAAKLRPFRHKQPARGVAPRSVIEEEQLPPSVIAADERVRDDGHSFVIEGVNIDPGPRSLGFHGGPLRAALRLSLAAAVDIVPVPVLKDAAEQAARAWRGLPSRQHILPTTDGRLWVDDALATIPEATITALDRFSHRAVCLILGGADRGQNFERLVKKLEARSQHRAFAFGPTSAKFQSPQIEHVLDFETAIKKSADTCPVDGVILFSPAAPSSAPFQTFQERSAVFAAFSRSVKNSLS